MLRIFGDISGEIPRSFPHPGAVM